MGLPVHHSCLAASGLEPSLSARLIVVGGSRVHERESRLFEGNCTDSARQNAVGGSRVAQRLVIFCDLAMWHGLGRGIRMHLLY